jgi:hypothetical protein
MKFPRKYSWKNTCKRAILTHEQSKWYERMTACDEFIIFRDVHYELTTSNIWRVALEKPDSIELMMFLAKLCCTPCSTTEITCLLCGHLYSDVRLHVALQCPDNDVTALRDTFVTKLFSISFNTYIMFIEADSDTLRLKYLLGLSDDRLIELVTPEKYADFLCVGASFLQHAIALYNSLN